MCVCDHEIIINYLYTYESSSFLFTSTNELIMIQNRPSTKVKSVPGGHSSLGYLFGDK